MKTSFIFIFAVAVLALAQAESTDDKFHRIHGECQEANAVTPHSLCMNVKLGVMNVNGDIDRHGLKAALSELPRFDSTIVNDILSNCGERKGSTAAEAAEALNKCMKERFLVYSPGTRIVN